MKEGWGFLFGRNFSFFLPLFLMADEGFDFSELLDGDADADDKLCIDLDTVMNVLDEDRDLSEVGLRIGLSLSLEQTGLCDWLSEL